MPKYCPECGEPVKQGAKFCNKCGHGLSEKKSPENVAPSTTMPVMPPAPSQITPGGRSAIGSAGYIMGIIALIFCIIGFVGAFGIFFWPLSFLGILGFIGFILSIVGIILGAIAYWGQWKDRRGYIGFILSLVALILFIVGIVVGYALTWIVFSSLSSAF